MGQQKQNLTSQIDGARDTFLTTFARVLGTVTVFYDGDQIQSFTEPSATAIRLNFVPPLPALRLWVEYETDVTVDGRVVGFSSDPSGVPAVQAGDLQAQLSLMAARITALENAGAPPASTGGPAGGVLAGSYPNPNFAPGDALPPNGPAGGDLLGTFPNPTLRPGALPTTLPPSGPASGDLQGTYPAPTLRAGAIPTSLPPKGPAGGDLDGDFPNPKLRAGVVPTVPSSLPPSGPAGGDLDGDFPNPTLRSGVLPTSLPPSGAASGDLEGSFPSPRLRAGLIPTVPTTLPPSGPASGDLQGTYPAPTIKPSALPTTLPPSGPAGGDLDGEFPNPKVRAGVVPTSLPPSGPASGDLEGNFPAPTIKSSAFPAALPPSGPAGGDLAGRFPDPVLARKGAITDDVMTFLVDGTWGPKAPTGGGGGGGGPTGPAGGDLSGTYPNPAVAQVGGISAASIAADLPSSTEKAGLVGTSGVPGGGNKFVTDADPRNTNSRAPSGGASGDLSGNYPNPTVAQVGGVAAATIAADLPSTTEKAALAGTNGTPSGANKFVTDTDPRLSGGGGGGGTITGQLLLTGVITPTILGGDQADYNPAGLSGASTIRLSSSLAVTISGIVGGAEGRVLILHNVGANVITLANDVSSVAANRFLLGGWNVDLQPDQSVALRYDATTSRWRAVVRDRLVERAILFLGANQSIPNGFGAATAILWGPSSVEAYRVGIGHDPNGPNPERFPIITSGIYTAWMFGLLTRANNLAYSYSVVLFTAAGNVRAVSTNCGLLSSTALADTFDPQGNVSLTFECNAGDFFLFSVSQKDPAGAANNLRGSASPGYTMCSIVRNQ